MKVPVYIQIHNQIRKEIESGKWSVGERIPSERQLSQDFDVSRMTLRQAIQTLVDEGILQRQVGSGTYVASSKVQEKMSGTTSFTEITESQGKKPSSKTVSYHVADPSISEMEKLKLKDGNQVLRMERIRYADNQPICFEVATIPVDIVKSLDKEDITSSLYKALETKAGLKLGNATQTVSAILASEKIANFLNVKRGSAILRVRQVTTLDDERPFEYVRSQYAGDRFEFYLER
ncbi:GntR family transcriptional regulator [Companilactobacillus bobalius]|uniref:Exu regulon transcriptional regulator n=2 Tax=Companilactobacillus bobalius TaxID=2801451 RepID=A0A202FCN4_9LACO|nr:GntR family transcriptional regulator [Companilactobacillus bobalius]KAE9561609.1 GntR family transcriptional regulator [Companilactobacillus bobalius]KRK82514.1 GntR family transcriptional regulator [Companilactobacillus bobalius DSM 19674]OVE98220.1 Exu regulon transcriptional regulator [Companilactobacillus bobalius]GEO58779.1 GntR family transcriptional regulator [Companilactobacillus paralimentarius]